MLNWALSCLRKLFRCLHANPCLTTPSTGTGCPRATAAFGLQRAAGETIQVRVLRERWQRPTADEARALGISPRHRALIREVELLGRHAQPWVFARTVIPATTLTGRERRLRLLGSRSLGSFLFRDPSLERTPLRACQLEDHHQQCYWARRSIFRLHGKPLLVCEVFLPAMEHVQYPF